MNPEIKISQLPAKGSNLAAADLLQVAEFTGTGYISKSITGQEIIDAAVGNVDWGDIGGTLSDQTDLNTALSGKVPTTRTLTINGTTQDLSADRTFTISTGITIGTTAITSGTVGRVLFQGTGNVVQESANLFWDNTNGRLGIGTSSPTSPFTLIGASQFGNAVGAGSIETFDGYYSYSFGKSTSIYNPNNNYTRIWMATSETKIDNFTGNFLFRSAARSIFSLADGVVNFYNQSNTVVSKFFSNTGNWGINTTTDAGYKLDVNGTARVSGNLTLTGGSLLMNNNNIYIARGTGGASDGMEIRALSSGTDAVKVTTSSVSISSVGGITYQASAQLAVDSTTRGFLPPRMTTTQKNAIASPATGLQIYDSTLNRPCFYDGTTWITL